jgi:hypothetical protein
VRYVEPRVAYQSLTANVLSAERPSSFASRELINLNLYQRFEDEPEKALAEMHSGLAPKGDEDRVFALAELSFVHAQNSGERIHYLASAVYAYAFLFPGEHGSVIGKRNYRVGPSSILSEHNLGNPIQPRKTP